MMKNNFKYDFTEPGFCQVHFKIKNKNNQYIYYCLMEDGTQVRMYRTSGPPWNEADYPVKFKEGVDLEFETPPDNYGKELLERFLKGEGK
jgi:hypothetical protein